VSIEKGEQQLTFRTAFLLERRFKIGVTSDAQSWKIPFGHQRSRFLGGAWKLKLTGQR
jgi:hypothetical protein